VDAREVHVAEVMHGQGCDVGSVLPRDSTLFQCFYSELQSPKKTGVCRNPRMKFRQREDFRSQLTSIEKIEEAKMPLA